MPGPHTPTTTAMDVVSIASLHLLNQNVSKVLDRNNFDFGEIFGIKMGSLKQARKKEVKKAINE